MTAPLLAGRGAAPTAVARQTRPRRIRLDDARTDRLFFAQVREDPELELAWLRAGPEHTVVVVGSGGCTALSLLASGTGTVVAVDVNPVQHHLVELKTAAVAELALDAARRFLGAMPSPAHARRRDYTELRGRLSDAAVEYWDRRPECVARGVLGSGVSERFIGVVVGVMRRLVHPRARIDRLLSCESLEAQQELYEREWDNRRWRGMFALLLNRWVFSRTYDPAFFEHLEAPSFAAHFRARAEHTLTRISIGSNYFLHQMLTGSYPVAVDGGVPPYLSAGGSLTLRRNAGGLTLVDGTYTAYLRQCPDASIDGFVLSNICEWLSPDEVDALFAEVARTAAPSARLCFRNFVGWTEVPERWRARVVEDRAAGDELMARDRSLVQRRFAACRVLPEAG